MAEDTLTIAQIEALLKHDKRTLATFVLKYRKESQEIHSDISELGFFIEALQKLSAEAGCGDCLSGDDLYFLLKPVKEELEFVLNNTLAGTREAAA